jgi:hypothetical protein
MRATLVVTVAVVLASCTSNETSASRPATAGTAASPSPIDCAATRPNGNSPPGERSRLSHGNGKLWVELWPRGHVRASKDDVRPDGSIVMKFPWTRGVRGELEITGRRLDAEAPPVRAEIPEGYGSIGFQASGIIFPTQGCWEITGRVGNVSLSFVTKVTKPQGT